ncbi:hypothetical protein KFE25_013251 [Diacronema lutheri]|uniref:Uncharacterized protein n=1 Tax=Diacronema lutheri TaxID=2081491 RepID=A0A8J5XIH7_DIALT|nr:hypothetical protein KFE25_004298 [Diacronema lutheri]KAG8468168.1 hypothetical protein KFE25_013251 [Diacronema lutheri]
MAEHGLLQRAECNEKTIAAQLRTQAILQLELENLIGQLRLQSASPAPRADAEPSKRKRSARRASAPGDGAGDGAGRPAASSSGAGYATPTDTDSFRSFQPFVHGHADGPLRPLSPPPAGARAQRLCSPDARADGAPADTADHVHRASAFDDHLHEEAMADQDHAAVVARGGGERILCDDDDVVYRSLPAAFGALGHGAPDDDELHALKPLEHRGAGAGVHLASVAPEDHGPLDEHELDADAGAPRRELAWLLAEAEALKAKLDSTTVFSAARLAAMCHIVRVWAELVGR